MKEIERKYLLKDKSVLKNKKHDFILQGYIHVDKEKEIRIRLYRLKEKAVICVKYKTGPRSGVSERDEFQTSIPYKEGVELYKKCKNILTKYRYSFSYGNGINIDIDLYNDGVMTVEVETPDRNLICVPDFCGKDVTGQWEYSNYRYAGFTENQFI